MKAPMVRAILDSTKTQTRRVVKPQPPAEATHAGVTLPANDWSWCTGDPRDLDSIGMVGDDFRCPYGQPGDRLWVRETFARIDGQTRPWIETDYRATYKHGDRLGDLLGVKKRWTPSIHMPRRASRITLEISDVRVERLHDISDADAIAEGIEPAVNGEWINYGNQLDHCLRPRTSYETLWSSLYGIGSWDANPWVWVISFRRLNETPDRAAA